MHAQPEISPHEIRTDFFGWLGVHIAHKPRQKRKQLTMGTYSWKKERERERKKKMTTQKQPVFNTGSLTIPAFK